MGERKSNQIAGGDLIPTQFQLIFWYPMKILAQLGLLYAFTRSIWLTKLMHPLKLFFSLITKNQVSFMEGKLGIQ